MARIPYILSISVLFIWSLAIKPSIQERFEDPDERDQVFELQPNATSSDIFLGPPFLQDKETRFLLNVTTRVVNQNWADSPAYATWTYIDFYDDAPLSGPEVNRTVLAFGFKGEGVGPRTLNHSNIYNGCDFIPPDCLSNVLGLVDQAVRVHDNGTLTPVRWSQETRELLTPYCKGALTGDATTGYPDLVGPYSSVQLFPATTPSEIALLQGRTALSVNYYPAVRGRSMEAAYDEAVNTPLLWVFYTGPSMTPNTTSEGVWQNMNFICIKPDTALPGSRAIGAASGLQAPAMLVLLLVGMLTTISQVWL